MEGTALEGTVQKYIIEEEYHNWFYNWYNWFYNWSTIGEEEEEEEIY
jgi:hypothetical protein